MLPIPPVFNSGSGTGIGVPFSNSGPCARILAQMNRIKMSEKRKEITVGLRIKSSKLKHG
jgi:hypothetical protein